MATYTLPPADNRNLHKGTPPYNLNDRALHIPTSKKHTMDDSPWITLRGNNVTLHEPIIDASNAVLPDSKPSYVVFVGKLSKTILLDELFGGPRHTGSLPVHRDVYLRSSPKLRADRTPLVIIDSGVQGRRPPDSGIRTVTKETSWTFLTDTNDYNATLCARVFSVFSSVICYFVHDLGGLKATAARLAKEVILNDTMTSDSQARPRVLLVLPTSSDSFQEIVAAHKVTKLVTKALRLAGQYGDSAVAQQQVHRHFAGLEVIALQSNKSSAVQAKALRHRLLAMSQASMQERASTFALFNFRHFLDLSKKLLGLVCSDPGRTQTLSLAHASRSCGFSTSLLEHCLTDLLQQIPSQAWLWHFVAPLIASALMLASYPPGAHGESECLTGFAGDVQPLTAADFAPSYLFKELYLESCRAAISVYTASKQIQDQFLRAVLNEFNTIFARRLHLALPTAELHRQILKEHHPHLATLRSHQSCFCCFAHMPEKVIACGHALCDSCIQIFGTRSRAERNSYELSECVLCGVSYQKAVFRFVPPTAGIRRLSVDGGGVKGIIPLMFLQHIDTLLAPLGLPVQDYFDMVLGTSAGAFRSSLVRCH